MIKIVQSSSSNVDEFDDLFDMLATRHDNQPSNEQNNPNHSPVPQSNVTVDDLFSLESTDNINVLQPQQSHNPQYPQNPPSSIPDGMLFNCLFLKLI